MPPKGRQAATPVKREPSIERTSEYEEFIKTLEAYHEARGTTRTWEPEPKVGTRHLDLLRLYKRVVEEGGYDLVSDTKAKPLMWRKVAEEFLGKGPHLAAQAFMVKSAYYKNLVAYEITEHWKKEAPPKEILEELTAKGGNVMSRTLENFERPSHREEETLGNGNSSDNEHAGNTPKQDKMDVDDPGSAIGRSTRGLRQAPPQRVLFQPDVAPARQSRNASNQGHVASPSPARTGAGAGSGVGVGVGVGAGATSGVTPGAGLGNAFQSSSYLANGTPMTLANYEPKVQYPLSLKPVTTPGNNPEYYKLKRKQQQDANASHVAKKYKGLMLPGTGFIGPNIYVRAQLALQSGLPDEEEYALHHLVKISHERGDKYRFDQFAGLAEALIAKVLQVTNLFYDIDWTISYDDDDEAKPGETCYLDGIHGTADVLEKLRSRISLDNNDDDIQTAHFRQALGRITEAALVIRNMVMLEENAQYISRLPLIRDYFCIVLNLKPHSAIVELQHYALETAEQLTKYYDLDAQDLLYRSLLAQLESSDRGKIVTSLRAISRIGMLFQANKRLEDVPVTVVNSICDWMTVEDDELRSACLDFLFQYSSIADNVETLVLDTDINRLVRQLSNLLLFQVKQDLPRSKPPIPKDEPQPTQVPRLSKQLVEQLLRYDEPERSSHWLRMCFQDDPQSEMTQIHLWQSYQGTFLPYAATHPHLIAGDFIKNVSNTFSGASAQVAGSNKYVIRGIKPRRIPVDYKNRELVRCQWRYPVGDTPREYSAIFAYADGTECGEWFGNNNALLSHCLSTHLQVPFKPRDSTTPLDGADGPKPPPRTPSAAVPTPAFDFAAAANAAATATHNSCTCQWSACSKTLFPATAINFALLARHIETHLPDESPKASWKARHNQSKADAAQKPEPTPSSVHAWQRTLVDERNDAAGVPLGCALVLRNIARGIPQLALADSGDAPEAESLDDAYTGVMTAAADEERERLRLRPRGEEDDAEADAEAEARPAINETAQARASRELMKRIFDPVMDALFYTLAHNYVLKDYVSVVLKFIAQGGG